MTAPNPSAGIGYSGTPLIKKLGIKPGHRVRILGEPGEYWEWLGELPADVQIRRRLSDGLDFIHFFVDRQRDLERRLPALKKAIFPDGSLWVSWPKKSSGVKTDLTEGAIRQHALPLGLVDIKVCAVSDVWSGLKLVVRKELR